MDWPYDTKAPPRSPAIPAPSWGCPHDLCECSPVDDVASEEFEFSVMLFDRLGKRMAGAACRLTYQGRVLNEDQPYADECGWVTAIVPRVPAQVLVEWAPADKPIEPGYPHQTYYYVDVDKSRDEGARRRLHNIGYSLTLSLEENIKIFQRDHGYEDVNGELDDIWDDLCCYHDEGRIPEARPAGGTSGGRGGGRAGELQSESADERPGHAFAPGLGKGERNDTKGRGNPEERPVKAEPQRQAKEPPTKGATKVGQGSCKLDQVLPTLPEMIAKKYGKPIYQFERIYREVLAKPGALSDDDLRAHFWIMCDALMWEVPDDEKWKCWVESEQPFAFPYTPYKMSDAERAAINRKRLVRIPCSALEAQEAAGAISFTQAELLSFSASGRDPGPALPEWYPPTRPEAMPCLLPTSELMDQLYLESDIKVRNDASFMYRYEKKGDKTEAVLELPAVAANKYNNHINKLVMDAWPPDKVPSPLQGNCGKIWALAQGMNTVNGCMHDGKATWTYSAINHGFYFGEPVAGFGHMKQYRGRCHDRGHKDYSQVFVCVAGWCLVKPPREPWRWMKTEEVYLHSPATKDKKADKESLARLVRTEPGPMPATEFGTPNATDSALIRSNNKNNVKP